MSCWILKGPWGSWSPDLGGGDQIAGRCPSCRDLPPAPRIQSLSARSFFRQEGRWVGIKKNLERQFTVLNAFFKQVAEITVIFVF